MNKLPKGEIIVKVKSLIKTTINVLLILFVLLITLENYISLSITKF